jgi:hypothetical protein
MTSQVITGTILKNRGLRIESEHNELAEVGGGFFAASSSNQWFDRSYLHFDIWKHRRDGIINWTLFYKIHLV